MYTIRFSTYHPNKTAEQQISEALGFGAKISHGTLVDIFSQGEKHNNGVFSSKRAANRTAEYINKRGAFGGFGAYAVTATVVA